jgi:Tfp pilus assembly protein PilN
MIEINLIPDVKQELLKAQSQRARVITISLYAGLTALGLVILLAVYVFAVQGVRSAIADDIIKRGNEELSQVEDLSKILTIQNQLAQIDVLNQDKKRDSRIFDVLEAVLPPAPNQVLVSSLALDVEQTSLVIEGQTSSFDTLEVFKKTISGAVVTYTEEGEEQSITLAQDISISNVSYGEDATGARVLRFTLSFSYPVELFSAQIPSILIKLTNEGNVTDSYLGIPRSIFVDAAEGGQQ